MVGVQSFAKGTIASTSQRVLSNCLDPLNGYDCIASPLFNKYLPRLTFTLAFLQLFFMIKGKTSLSMLGKVVMSQFLADQTLVLAGYGFLDHDFPSNDFTTGGSSPSGDPETESQSRSEVRGPYLLLNAIESSKQIRYPLWGKTISLFRTDRRFCIGRFDLRTFESSVCPLKIEFLPSEKDNMCPACREATGFNPSFYYADSISPQQREYNQTPHFVYMAYFSPDHVKAGISSETRGIERLLEQGARSACIVGRFSNADEARILEAALCSQPGIAETMRVSLKARLLMEVSYDSGQAASVLQREMARVAEVPEVSAAGFAPEEIKDLNAYYFQDAGTESVDTNAAAGFIPGINEMQIPDNATTECAGKCVGMVGGLLILEQNDQRYVISLKEWETHAVQLFENEVRVEYESVPQQFSLF